MKWILYVVAVLLFLAGAVWFLQGINLLPGSFMTGQTQWAVIGSIMMILGAGLFIFTNRRNKLPPSR